MNERIFDLVSKANTGLLVTGIVVILLVFDGVITSLPFYNLQSQQEFQIGLFYGVEVFICAASQFIYLKIIKRKYSTTSSRGHLKKFADTVYSVVSLTQYFIIALLMVTIIEIGILREYDTFTLRISILLSLGLSTGLSGLLALRFFLWTRYRRDYVVVAYSVAAIVLALNSTFVAIFISLEMQNKPNLIDSSRTAITSTMVVNYDIKQFQSNLSFASFVSLWIASIFLLRHYRRKWGLIKFYSIIFIPLVYYLGVLQLVVSSVLVPHNILNTFQLYSFNVINSILTRPVGGALFGVSFWLLGKRVDDKNISNYMKFSAIGIILLSMSNQDAGLYLLPYPPFGLSTVTFVGISSYLLFIGLYYTSISISLDTELRKSIDKSVGAEFKFVSNIGRYQLERDIEDRVKGITKLVAKELEANSGVEASPESENIQEYIRAVIKEKEKMLKGNNSPFRIYPIDSTPCGRSWDEWVQLWWKWCYSEPIEKSPTSDDSGVHCSRGQIYEKVWFLAGTFGGPPAERTCKIPEGRSIFFPLINDFISFATDPDLKTEDELRAYAKRDLDEARSLYLRINELELRDLNKYRISTSIFELAISPKETSGIPVTTQAISDGYWIFLEPLPAGYYRIKFGGEKLEYDKMQMSMQQNSEIPKFRVDVTYNLEVI